MRNHWLFVAALLIVSPLARGDDKAKRDDLQTATKKPAEQLAELRSEYSKEFEKILTEFRESEEPEERAKIRDKAFKLAPEYAKKIMAIVEAHPKDPAVVDGLIWIATVSESSRVPPPPQAKEASDRLVRDHLGNPAIQELLPALEARPDGEGILRKIREQNSSKLVKVLAGLALANMLTEGAKPSRAAEAEAVLVSVVADAKSIKDFPAEKLREAEGNLFELRHLSIGKSAPDIESTDLDGKKVKLSDHKGKVVVLDIWTTWCPPCRAMIPHERELVKKLEGKPFVLVSVSGDDDKDTLTKFIEKEPMPWTHWFNGPSGGILEKWNVKFFPTIYVIDAKGTIRFKNIRNKELDEAVESLVKEAEEKK
jgi:thiol-disulfide isomerase/thioredoxin